MSDRDFPHSGMSVLAKRHATRLLVRICGAGDWKNGHVTSDDAATDVLLFRPEAGAESPLWNEQGQMVWLDQLPLPQPLRDHLSAWAFDAFQTDDEEGLAGEGRRLLRQVEAYLPAQYKVIWDYGDEPTNDPFATF